MRFTHAAVVQTVAAIQHFLDQNAASLGNVPSSNARARLDDVARKLEEHGRKQVEVELTGTLATQTRLQARDTLIREHMQPIADIARAEAHREPELALITMPRLNVNDQVLIQNARAMAEAASLNKDIFVTGGLALDFLSQMDEAITALVNAREVQKRSIVERVAATRGLEVEGRTALKRIRVLNNFVRPHTKGDEPLARAWKNARKVARKPVGTQVSVGGQAGATNASATTTPAATTPPTGSAA
jgi:hypothetical protein